MEPFVTGTDCGTVSPELLLLKLTVKPLLDAPFKPIVPPVVDVPFSVTVHVVEPLPVIDVGLHVIDATVGVGARATLAV